MKTIPTLLATAHDSLTFTHPTFKKIILFFDLTIPFASSVQVLRLHLWSTPISDLNEKYDFTTSTIFFNVVRDGANTLGLS